jgi:hypothetical protein
MADSPDKVLDHGDPGDDVQLRFRYQHGYGVILLAGSTTKRLAYVAIWCEHHDDLLGESADGMFDKDLRKSFGKFVKMDLRFPRKFRRHKFVSNVKFFDTTQVKEIAKSPIQFLKMVQKCKSATDLPVKWAKVLKSLADDCGCATQQLFETCHKVDLIVGPSKEAFDAEIAHEHLPKLNGCAQLSPAELDGLRDELIQTVFKASSLSIDDPSKHWCCVLGSDHLNPKLMLKRLTIPSVVDDVLAGKALLFRFAPAKSTLKLQDGRSELRILQKKMVKGGLAGLFDGMQWRTLSAENHLLSLAAKDADEAAKIINQLKGVVKGACDDAAASASASKKPWGEAMYRQVVQRLEKVAENHPDLVYHQPYDCLVGVAGLLTEQCEVWWSKPFDLKEAV